jgi:hypothetical protein
MDLLVVQSKALNAFANDFYGRILTACFSRNGTDTVVEALRLFYLEKFTDLGFFFYRHVPRLCETWRDLNMTKEQRQLLQHVFDVLMRMPDPDYEDSSLTTFFCNVYSGTRLYINFALTRNMLQTKLLFGNLALTVKLSVKPGWHFYKHR